MTVNTRVGIQQMITALKNMTNEMWAKVFESSTESAIFLPFPCVRDSQQVCRKNFLKRAIPEYLVRDTDIFFLSVK